MQTTTPAQRAHHSSFRRSIASIHQDASRNGPRSSRRHSTGGGGVLPPPPRRSMSGGAVLPPRLRVDLEYSPPYRREMIGGYSGSPKGASPVTSSVDPDSFTNRQDKSTKMNQSSTVRHSPTAIRHSTSLHSSHDSALTNRSKNLSTSFHSTNTIELPFSEAPTPPTNEMTPPTRRHSMLDMGRLDEERAFEEAPYKGCQKNKHEMDSGPPTKEMTPPTRRHSMMDMGRLDEERAFEEVPRKGRQKSKHDMHSGPPTKEMTPPTRRHSMLDMERLDEERAFEEVPRKGRQKNKHEMHSGPRKDYSLGDVARSPSHMVHSADMISHLKAYDFAFIKRTDGSWTYSILAHRNDSTEEDMFVINKAGSTKVIKQAQLAEYVRCVAEGGDRSPCESVPKSISLDDSGEDCSLVTFLS